MIKLSGYKYFKPYEFECCSPRCSISDMRPEFIQCLDAARDFAGVPFILNSAFRSKEYEISHGRTGTSSHTKGLAVDIRCSDSRQRYLIVNSLIAAGFTRIGIAKTFIHVDSDPEKRSSIWLY